MTGPSIKIRSATLDEMSETVASIVARLCSTIIRRRAASTAPDSGPLRRPISAARLPKPARATASSAMVRK
jgi:hypothetical protein